MDILKQYRLKVKQAVKKYYQTRTDANRESARIAMANYSMMKRLYTNKG